MPARAETLGFEELAWTLFEHTAADQMFVYRTNETDGSLDPVLALGTLSLAEKQSFWASQLNAEGEPVASLLSNGSEANLSAYSQVDNAVFKHLHAKTWIGFPLLSREGLLGVVLIGWFEQGASLDEPRRKLAQIIARAMALESDTARLYEQTHQQRRQARIAQEMTQAILRRDSLADTLAAIAGEGMRAVDALGCALWLVDDQGQRSLAAQVGQPMTALTDTSVVDLLQAQAPFVVPAGPETEDEPENILRVIAPLVSGQKTVGYLEITQMADYHQPKDLAAARAFADQAAVAVELDRLYGRLQQTAVAEERARLARDLHDSVSQSIYAMTLYTRAARRQLSEGNVDAVEKYLSDLHTTAREALGEMRMLIYELRPMALERYGLKGILEQRLQSVEARSGLEVSLEYALSAPLPPHLEENLYHIALEALNNTIKHAQANRVAVSIRQEDGEGEKPGVIHLVVRDDGAGFDPAEVVQGGVGMKSIRERVTMLRGQLMIETRPGAGVTLSIEVPYAEDSNSDRR